MVTRLVEREGEEAKNRKSDEGQSTRAKHAPSPVSRRRHRLGKSTRLHFKRRDITSSDGELAKELIDGVVLKGVLEGRLEGL